MTIKKKTVYETSDKKTFLCEVDAIFHQAALDAFEKAYNEKACYGRFEFADENEFADFVLKYADMIRSGEGKDR